MAITIYLSLFFLVLYAAGLVIHRYIFVRDKRRMQDESREGRRLIARVEELPPGRVKKFWLICRTYRVDGFLVNDHGSFYAYINRCRHMATPLDFTRDQFLAKIDCISCAIPTAPCMSRQPDFASPGRARENRFARCRCAWNVATSW